MPAKDCTVNRILDSLVSCASAIGKDGNAEDWYTTPQTIQPFSMFDTAAIIKPAILFDVEEVGPFLPQTNWQGEQTCTIKAWLLPSGEGTLDDARREVHQLAADLIKAIRDDFQLGNDDEEDPVLATGHIWDEGYIVALASRGAGNSVEAEMTLKATWLEG